MNVRGVKENYAKESPLPEKPQQLPVLNSNTSDQGSDSESDNDDEEDDEQDQSIGGNIYTRFLSNIKTGLSALFKNAAFRIFLLFAAFIAYGVYFGFAIYLTKPFNVPSNLNSTDVLTNHIFSNNRGWFLI
jgi:hypothetical protein